MPRNDDFKENRRTARLDVPIRVEYRVVEGQGPGVKGQEEARGAVTKDVSAAGCLLIATENIPIDSVIELDIMLGDRETEALKISGKIVRLNRHEKDLYEYGIAFDNIGKEARRLFADYFFAKMYDMIGLSNWPTDKRIKNK